MDLQEKARRLRNMLAQLAPKRNVQEMALESVTSPFAEMPGVESAGDVRPVVESGLRKLAENRVEEATPQELMTLEAIVMPQNRPVVFVRGHSYDDVDAPWQSLNAATEKDRIAKLFPLIGRIELPLSPLIPYGGTGFVVGKGLLMTNRHVAQLFSHGLGLDIRYDAGGSAIDFKRQIDTADDDRSEYLKVIGVEMIHPFWDMALLRVEGLKSDKPLNLSTVAPEDLIDRDVVAVGYPAKDYRNDLDLQDRIFAGKYNVKRLQPGKIRPRGRIQSFENVVNAMIHDASTLGGNSGSAIVDIEKANVVALHFAGEYLKANYAVPMYELARDPRVAPLLNFDNSVAPTNDWEPAWQRTESEATPTPDVQSPTLKPATSTWTVPLQLTISIGAQPSVSISTEPSTTEVEAVVVNQNYSDREGYDPHFLDTINVLLPKLSTAMQNDTATVRAQDRKHNDPFELTYYHYSVYMNKKRRTAWFSAANIDGAHRPNIGAREGDRWYVDPRIAATAQLAQDAFEHGIDRGHLTRRLDTAWGTTVAKAKAANNDTFHFTNCSLQASAFNQGKDRWQGLEQFLLEQHAEPSKKRMVVITGPLFAANDPVYKNSKMNYSVRCPLQFWKVCVLIRKDGTPSATAFILGQEEIADLPGFAEAFDVAATQIKIKDLEKKTGLDFGDLRTHDHFADGGAPGTIEAVSSGTTEATRGGKIIHDPNDIVV